MARFVIHHKCSSLIESLRMRVNGYICPVGPRVTNSCLSPLPGLLTPWANLVNGSPKAAINSILGTKIPVYVNLSNESCYFPKL